MPANTDGASSTSSPEKRRGETASAQDLSAELSQDVANAPRILLIDDDPIFGKIMGRLAEQSRVNLTFCRSLDELGEKAWWRYHAAIVDFDLGTATGLQLIGQMEKVLGSLPVILVSGGNQIDVPVNRWPISIKGFLQKSLGHVAILEAALAAHDMAHEQAVQGRHR